ncbi:MAG: elongation factor P [Anaerolineae bacterium]
MITATQLRKGTTFELDGELYKVLTYQHYKPGRGNAVIRTTLRNLRKGTTIERNFLSGERFQDVRLDHSIVQYLYHDGDLYYFMDTKTFEQTPLSAEILGDAVNYLKEGLELELSTYEGEPIDIELPTTVDLEVTEAEPGYAGDTATGATKQVTVETGLKVQTPLFVEVGDVIRVDTRDGSYVTRV